MSMSYCYFYLVAIVVPGTCLLVVLVAVETMQQQHQPLTIEHEVTVITRLSASLGYS